MDLYILFYFIERIINDNTNMVEWVYPIIVENIYHDEVKDFLITTPKCVLIHSRFHLILNKFGHFDHGETS
jgi:hypothetical protein